jgi:hypothetical protein
MKRLKIYEPKNEFKKVCFGLIVKVTLDTLKCSINKFQP